jgi:hypothetical protein
VIWFFGRDDQGLRVETRNDSSTAEYLLVICGPDGDQSERFTDVADFRSRLVQVENRLEIDRWNRTRDPAIVPDAFPQTRDVTRRASP